MTGERDRADQSSGQRPQPDLDETDGAPVDFDLIDRTVERLAGDERFVEIEREPTVGPRRLVCQYDLVLYPSTVSAARLDVAWFENGDFSIHYHETHLNEQFDHRWDRHPSAHNTRDHIHPGPDAPTPGKNASHPPDWRDMLSAVLSEIETRQRGFWTL